MQYKKVSIWSTYTSHVPFDFFAGTTPTPEGSALGHSPAARPAVARRNPDAWDVLHREALGQESAAQHGSLGVKSCVTLATSHAQDAKSATHLQPRPHKVRMCCQLKLTVLPRPQLRADTSRSLAILGQTQHGACSCRAAPVPQCADSKRTPPQAAGCSRHRTAPRKAGRSRRLCTAS